MTSAKRNLGWLWYLLTLALLAIVAIAWLIFYNMGQQLKPEQLAAARLLWQQNGPSDYRLVYTVKRGLSEEPDHYVVTVRGGKAVSAVYNNRLREPEERLRHYGMPALFNFIEDDMRLDAQPGQARTYSRAIFDAGDGHLRWYVRRIMGSKQRQEITVESLQPLDPEPGPQGAASSAALAFLTGPLSCRRHRCWSVATPVALGWKSLNVL
jgi:hypothetical protein